MRSKTPKRTIPKVGPWPCTCDGHRIHWRHFAGMAPEKGAVIRSPLAITVGHGLTGPPCPVGESVPCSSGLLIPRLRMTGRKRRPFWMDSLTRPPFGWSFSGFILIDRGSITGHAHTLAVVMAWKCSHVHPFLLIRSVTHQGAPRGGHRCFGFLSWLDFLNRRVPVLRWCGAHPATVRGRTPRDVSGK
jgi:hypothetical protein